MIKKKTFLTFFKILDPDPKHCKNQEHFLQSSPKPVRSLSPVILGIEKEICADNSDAYSHRQQNQEHWNKQQQLYYLRSILTFLHGTDQEVPFLQFKRLKHVQNDDWFTQMTTKPLCANVHW